MAKKLGKRASKKGLDTRDYLVFGGYFFLFVILIYFATTGRQKNLALKKQQTKIDNLEGNRKRAKSSVKRLGKKLATERERLRNSEVRAKREKQEYDFVVGTSLEYAKKNRLLMAIWEAIDKVQNVALRTITVEKNDISLSMVTQSDVYLTEFMTALNKRKDLIDTIRIKETKIEKADKKTGRQLLVGTMEIVAVRPRSITTKKLAPTTRVIPKPRRSPKKRRTRR
jgi:Tfp pilus assembly protein PilN